MRCVKCGESWDNDCLHDEISARLNDGRMKCRAIGRYESGNIRYDQDQYSKLYDLVAAEFRSKGCATITAYRAKCSSDAYRRSMLETISVVYDALGDDMDGASAMLDDIEYLFG